MKEPVIIQGGMGVGVSHWPLARAVSLAGQLGVVSGTALDTVLARRLQMGDPEGHLRRALSHFPNPDWVKDILDTYFIPGGKPLNQRFKPNPLCSLDSDAPWVRLTVVASFAEVFLAKENHGGLIGINLLEKIQLPTLPSLLGAMLAGVDYVLMGAGIPRSIPGILDQLAQHQPVELKLDVQGVVAGEEVCFKFDMRRHGLDHIQLHRPKFLAIVSSAVLATALARKSNGRVDGFIVEGSNAGGHNAPPRGPLKLNEKGEPIYGPKDDPEIDKIRALGLPFWLAGSCAEPSKLSEALQKGATGVQIGTAFAFCEESGIQPQIRKQVLELIREGAVHVHTDPVASPTGFPFKVLQMEDSLSEDEIYSQRERVCDLGYLRHAYLREDRSVGFRCPGEPEEIYKAKGGVASETEGRKCVCNGLMATIGLAQVRSDEYLEKPLITAGDDVVHLSRFFKNGETSYSASDVVRFLLAGEICQKLA